MAPRPDFPRLVQDSDLRRELQRASTPNTETLHSGGGGPYGGDGGDGMRERIAKLETQFEHIDARLNRIEDKLLSKWDVAKVQAGMILFAITLIMLGPRLLSLLEASGP